MSLASATQQSLSSRAGQAVNQAMAAAGAPPGSPLAAAAGQLAALDAAGVTTLLHVTPAGDPILASGIATANGGDLVLHGSIGPIPYELHIHLQLDGTQLTITLTVVKPIPLGPYTWTFDLGGIIKDAQGRIIGASTLAPAAAQVAATAAGQGFNPLCLLQCAGAKILPIALECLPSLIGGVQAFVACLIAKLGASAPDIIQCIIQCF